MARLIMKGNFSLWRSTIHLLLIFWIFIKPHDAANSRHGTEISTNAGQPKTEDEKNGIRKVLKEDGFVKLTHVVNICKTDPSLGTKGEIKFDTRLEFRPCLENRRHEWSLRFFLGITRFWVAEDIDEEFKTVEYKAAVDIHDEDMVELLVNGAERKKQLCKVEDPGTARVRAKCTTSNPITLSPEFPARITESMSVIYADNMSLEYNPDRKAFDCDEERGSVKMMFNVTITAPKVPATPTGHETLDERVPLESLYGEYIFKSTKTNLLKFKRKVQTRYLVVGDSGGQCGRKEGRVIVREKPDFEKVGVMVGSLFIGGFVIIVVIAIAYYTHQWRKGKKRRTDQSQQNFTVAVISPSNEVEETVVMPREDEQIGSANAPEPGEIPADGGTIALRRPTGRTPTAPPASNAAAHAPSVAIDAKDKAKAGKGGKSGDSRRSPRGGGSGSGSGSGGKQSSGSGSIRRSQLGGESGSESGGGGGSGAKHGSVKKGSNVGSLKRGTRGADGRPSFLAFCDHPVVVGIWCFLLVGNVTALIVSLALLPMTHPIDANTQSQ